MRGGTEHATKEMNWAIPWKGQPEHENQISFKTLIIWYHWKTKTFKNFIFKSFNFIKKDWADFLKIEYKGLAKMKNLVSHVVVVFF